MSERNKKVVLEFIEAFSRGDGEATKACLAPGACAVAKGFGKLSSTRSYEDMVANAAAFKELIPTGLRPNVKSVIADGDRVAVEFEGDATLANGERYCNQYCFVFTLQDGRIKVLHEYFCTILADQKIGPLLTAVEARRKHARA
jgi:ketosteroid isomerase-like protein